MSIPDIDDAVVTRYKPLSGRIEDELGDPSLMGLSTANQAVPFEIPPGYDAFITPKTKRLPSGEKA